MEYVQCQEPDCTGRVFGRGLCSKHYYRKVRSGEIPSADTRCTIEDCEKKHYAKGYCNAHYRRWKLYGDPLGRGVRKQRERQPEKCTVKDCPRAAATRELCHRHYQRWKRHGDPLGGRARYREDLPEHCAVEGCPGPPASRGWCYRHYNRWKTYGDPEAPMRRAPNGAGWRGLNKDGYVVIKKNGTTRLEHRLVMETVLGRPLRPFENVHHKAPDSKTDNRPENLELWVRVQPSGQRLDDILDWMVSHYPDETRAALARQAASTATQPVENAANEVPATAAISRSILPET